MAGGADTRHDGVRATPAPTTRPGKPLGASGGRDVARDMRVAKAIRAQRARRRRALVGSHLHGAGIRRARRAGVAVGVTCKGAKTGSARSRDPGTVLSLGHVVLRPLAPVTEVATTVESPTAVRVVENPVVAAQEAMAGPTLTKGGSGARMPATTPATRRAPLMTRLRSIATSATAGIRRAARFVRTVCTSILTGVVIVLEGVLDGASRMGGLAFACLLLS